MSNRTLILILLIILSGCSAVKTAKTRTVNKSLISADNIKETRNNNLSNKDFNVQRADVVSEVNGDKQKFIAFFKYRLPGIWLISIKSNTGIEAARAWITADTIIINDRLHKKLYYAKSSALEKKYGIPVKAIPVLIGDFIESGKVIWDSIPCNEGSDEEVAQFENFKVDYIINCKENKAISTKIVFPGKRDIQISFSKVNKSEDKKFPAKIIIRDSEGNINIEIQIRKIDFNNIERLDFIPGKGYEKILMK